MFAFLTNKDYKQIFLPISAFINCTIEPHCTIPEKISSEIISSMMQNHLGESNSTASLIGEIKSSNKNDNDDNKNDDDDEDKDKSDKVFDDDYDDNKNDKDNDDDNIDDDDDEEEEKEEEYDHGDSNNDKNSQRRSSNRIVILNSRAIETVGKVVTDLTVGNEPKGRRVYKKRKVAAYSKKATVVPKKKEKSEPSTAVINCSKKSEPSKANHSATANNYLYGFLNVLI